MKKVNLAQKEKLGLTKKIIVKLSSGTFNFGTDGNTSSTTSGDTELALVAFLTQ